jgi:hypothetical protein
MVRSQWLLSLEFAVMVVAAALIAPTGCSSSDSSADASSDSSADDGGGASSGSSSGSSSDTGLADSRACHPSIPEAGGDGGTPPVCLQCLQSNCAAETAACTADSVCAASNKCLLSKDLNYPSCPEAIAAISSGNVPLKNLAGCTATHCMSQCVPTASMDPCGASDAQGQ